VDPIKPEYLKQLASKYIWWKTPTEALEFPERVIAQVMNMGDYDDLHQLTVDVGDDVLRKVIADAEAGQFNERSWTYWHYRLGLAELDRVPPMPVRKFA
jgi:hypothetical protein